MGRIWSHSCVAPDQDGIGHKLLQVSHSQVGIRSVDAHCVYSISALYISDFVVIYDAILLNIGNLISNNINGCGRNYSSPDTLWRAIWS